ncbi:MAG: nucleoside triphosphate pyrophosphohydrolase [Clostridia bacterium]|nr:nucleoside triphosphate pyrophosphohydrolase [Clostridia bacterium]
MVENFRLKDRYTVDDLREIVTILRAPGGCPWDREQTHETLKKDLIEECYEVIEAINKGDPAMLREELGDVLLQVVFHADLARDENAFGFDDVCDEICKKLIVRHPHVFGDVKVSSTEEVLDNWDEIKKKTKNQKTLAETIESVPRELPALMRTQKIQKKASKSGYDFPDTLSALAKVEEELAEVRAALAEKDAEAASKELGDLLFSVVNVCRFADADAEEALTGSTDTFVRRVLKTEELANAEGVDITGSIAEFDRLWEEAKRILSN